MCSGSWCDIPTLHFAGCASVQDQDRRWVCMDACMDSVWMCVVYIVKIKVVLVKRVCKPVSVCGCSLLQTVGVWEHPDLGVC